MPTSPAPELAAQASRWMAKDPDPATVAELRELLDSGAWAALTARLGGRLAFGTAGLRAPVGAGPRRMNRLVVRETTAGLLDLLGQVAPWALARGIVVGFDGRTDSRRFAADVAGVAAARGTTVWWVGREAPTPLTGFAVRSLPAGLGIVVTASHNPASDNGIKVYWHDGIQLVPPVDRQAADAIAQVAAADERPPCLEGEDLACSPQMRPLDPAVAAAYLRSAVAAVARPPAPAALARSAIKIAYTPLHGVGGPWAREALAQAGFDRVVTVPEQADPDGRFPTVRYPNPEDPAALARLVDLAVAAGCDLALANDPDADRLAVALPEPDAASPTRWRILSGDELGCLMAAYLLPSAPAGSVVATTVASGERLPAMAAAHGVPCFVSLTGFKWLALGMRDARSRGLRPLFAYEEALGFALGSAVWDKDGIAAAVLVADMVADWRAQGTSAWDKLAELDRVYGRLRTAQRSLPRRVDGGGTAGAASAPAPASVGRFRLLDSHDLRHQLWPGPWGGPPYPPSNVAIWHLADGRRPGRRLRIIVRPSGTEPKVKCYYQLQDLPADDDDELDANACLNDLITAHHALMDGASGQL